MAAGLRIKQANDKDKDKDKMGITSGNVKQGSLPHPVLLQEAKSTNGGAMHSANTALCARAHEHPRARQCTRTRPRNGI
jgi:hypothetical protein